MLNLRIHSIKWKTSLLPKIALLIDAENISYKYLPHILKEVSIQGQITLRAVYGNWRNPSLCNWYAVAQAHNFKIRHQSNSGTKNASDMRLILDAMEVLFYLTVDIFCLVTNDADFVPLCDKLHEARKQVIGVGSQQASVTFIRSCDKFFFIGREATPTPPFPLPVNHHTVFSRPPASPQPQWPLPSPFSTTPTKLKKLLTQAYSNAKKDSDGWVTVATLGGALHQLKSDFKSKMYGHSTLSKLLQSMPDFIEVRSQSDSLWIRLKK
jgi:uncharacterized protein (TIGR00288 family)